MSNMQLIYEKLYDSLYFLAFKALLVDNTTLVPIDEQYMLKIKFLADGVSSRPELALMIAKKYGEDVYEHCVNISKVNDVRGMSALLSIMRKCSDQEKATYILENDLTVNDKPYRLCYLPIHLKPISKQLLQTIVVLGTNAKNYLEVMVETNHHEQERQLCLK